MPSKNMQSRNSALLGYLCGAYAVLSSKGHYRKNVDSYIEAARIDAISSEPDSDREEWQPKWIIVTRYPKADYLPLSNSIHASLSGYLFSPLVVVDRLFVHRTRNIQASE
jgi:hypothetical protein